MSKKLVAYFSATGTTKKLSEEVAKLAGADLFEIKPETPYTSDDLNWMNKNSRSTIESKDRSSRPVIAETIDTSGYDTIYIGYPVWWYTVPTIINTFLESIDTDGKKIVLFGTSGGSSFGKAVSDLEGSAPNATFVEGKINPIQKDIENFIK